MLTIHQTTGEFTEKFEKKDLKAVVNVPEEPVVVRVDGRRMWRVIENIYNNAAKYAMPSTRIYVDMVANGKVVVLSLKNVSEYPLNITADELTKDLSAETFQEVRKEAVWDFLSQKILRKCRAESLRFILTEICLKLRLLSLKCSQLLQKRKKCDKTMKKRQGIIKYSLSFLRLGIICITILCD